MTEGKRETIGLPDKEKERDTNQEEREKERDKLSGPLPQRSTPSAERSIVLCY